MKEKDVMEEEELEKKGLKADFYEKGKSKEWGDKEVALKTVKFSLNYSRQKRK
jgi:hypothetical protein